MDLGADVTVDAKGQKCPMPVLLKDTGNELLDSSVEAGVYRYLIKKS